MKNKLRTFYIKTFNWEYWPMWLVYLPVSFYYIYLSIKAKSFFFFSAANPSIETGGMFFESKWDIFKLIPQKYFPTTILVAPNQPILNVLQQMQTANLSYPIIAKPDRGERGWCVQKINNDAELQEYVDKFNFPFLIQAYVDYKVELSVFYYRNPNNVNGILTSVTLKKLLTVTGNSNATIEDLIMQNDRAFLKYKALQQNTKIDFSKILKDGEEQVLVPYGNHVLGAKFLDYNHIIDAPLTAVFDKMSKEIKGFYFGRYDLLCNSIDDLKNGKSFLIVELNGSGAEPSHIYDPSFSFFKAQQVLAQHYNFMYQAAIANNKKGIASMSYSAYKATKIAEKEFKLNAQRLAG
jgi:hypothetical protein